MSDVLKRAESQFSARRKLKKIDVPEWEGAVYYYDPCNIEERNRVLEHYDAKSDQFRPDAMVSHFMVRARNEEGHRLFSDSAWEENVRRVKSNMDPFIVTRIVKEMGGLLSIFGGVTAEDAEKN